jgi:hypothetical protein
MPIGIRNLEWLNHNAVRAYPITADSTQRDVSGDFSLPQSLIVSLYFPVHFGVTVEPGKFFVRTVHVFSTGLQIVLGYAGSLGDVNVASALVPTATHSENTTYPLIGLGDFADSRGHLVVGSLEGLDNQPVGTFTFALTGARLEPDAIRPHLRTIPSIQVQNGSVLSRELSGHVVIQAGRNTRFRVVETEGQPARVIWDAVDGEGLTEDCVCDDGLAAPIRTIELVPPDGAGNFRFLGNDCLEFSGLPNGLLASDTCSEPCCGCQELEQITEALESFGERATTLENFLVSLEARVQQMDQVVLGSKLGDRGCTPAQQCP